MALPAKPLYPYPGGKRALLPRLRVLANTEHRRLVEPFCGGAALTLDRRPARALLGDVNAELIATYASVRADPTRVLEALRALPISREYYQHQRDQVDPLDLSSAEAAARFIFLQNLGYNGLQRQNSAGRSNVAWGNKKWKPDERGIRLVSEALQSAELVCGDFEQTLQKVEPGDLCFIDSPYIGTFDQYVAGGFSVADHERLARSLHELSSRGVKLLITNSDAPEVRRLYAGFEFHTLPIRRNIASKGGQRTSVNELAMLNYKPNGVAAKTYSFPADKPQIAANNVQREKQTRAVGKLADTATKERLELVAELVRSQVPRGQILSLFKERFGGCARTADSYIRKVREESALVSVSALGPDAVALRKKERDDFLAELREDIAQAKQAGVWSAVSSLRKLECDTRGLRVVAPTENPAPPAAQTVNITQNVSLNAQPSPETRAHRLQLLKRVIAFEESNQGTSDPADSDSQADQLMITVAGTSPESDRSAG